VHFFAALGTACLKPVIVLVKVTAESAAIAIPNELSSVSIKVILYPDI
jgi:hypothetical protein